MKKTKNKNKTKNKQQKRTLMRNKGEPARSIMSHSMIRRYHLILKNPILFILFSTWDNKMSLFLKKISFSVVFWTKVDTDTGRRPINVACFFFSQQDNRMEEKENENFFSQTSLKKSRKKKKTKKKRKFLDSLTETQGQLFNSSHETWTNTLAHTQHHNQQVT